MNTPMSSLEKFPHFPVMMSEVIQTCNPINGSLIVDCTFGGGNYTKEFLKYPKTKVIALDRDKTVINKANKIKEKNPDLKIAIGGCVASQEGEKIIKRAPSVDIVFGPQTLHKLPGLYNEKEMSNENQIDISFPKLEKFDHLASPKAEGPSSFCINHGGLQ